MGLETGRIGSLCTGIGGLDIAVEKVYGGEMAWVSEIDRSALMVIDREWPGTPNLGDIKLIDWQRVEPVDIITAGYPCQPFSHAGKRQGENDARHLWPYIIEAVRHLRPRRLVLENVQGHLSKGFSAVVQDLAEAGFDAEWCLLRASDVGACHQRARLWVVATDASRSRRDGRPASDEPAMAGGHGVPPKRGEGVRVLAGGDPAAPDAYELATGRDSRTAPRPEEPDAGRSEAFLGDGPTDGAGAPRDHLILLPTPVVNDMGEGKTVERWDEWTAEMQGRHANGNGHGKSLAIEVQRIAANVDWGDYEPAIRRQEAVFGRQVPAPGDEAGRLRPSFVEWMMGYPEGWVDGLTRTQALKALGNAVVPQQGEVAVRLLEDALVKPLPMVAKA